MNEIAFTSHGVRCAAWHLPAAGDAFAGEHGRPCVVMAHGFGGTRDTGLLGYAEAFAGAGFDAVVFDYRGFGASQGEPRQLVSFRRQRQDYRAAVAAARRLPGVDPERIVLWGTSYSGGHVVAVAAADTRIAAAIALTPAMDGIAALAQIARYAGPGQLLRATRHGLRDASRALTGRPPHRVPIVGPPGSAAIISTPGADVAYHSIAGPTWRNEVGARTALEVAFNRPTRLAHRIRCPLLVQLGDHDSVAPPSAARAAAAKAGAELRSYPVDHFGVYAGAWQKRAIADQLGFLHRHLHVRRQPEETHRQCDSSPASTPSSSPSRTGARTATSVASRSTTRDPHLAEGSTQIASAP
jgi:pimeloyl-ACP methyl ester carboxylesterase